MFQSTTTHVKPGADPGVLHGVIPEHLLRLPQEVVMVWRCCGLGLLHAAAHIRQLQGGDTFVGGNKNAPVPNCRYNQSETCCLHSTAGCSKLLLISKLIQLQAASSACCQPPVHA